MNTSSSLIEMDEEFILNSNLNKQTNNQLQVGYTRIKLSIFPYPPRTFFFFFLCGAGDEPQDFMLLAKAGTLILSYTSNSCFLFISIIFSYKHFMLRSRFCLLIYTLA
jgi:hypothetical protein